MLCRPDTKFTEEDFDEEILEKNTLILADFLNICSDYFGTKNVSCLFVPSKIDVLVDKLPVFADVYSGSHVAGGVKKLVKNKINSTFFSMILAILKFLNSELLTY